MALTVVKNLTDISLCENITSWSGAPTAGTTFVREGTNSLGVPVSNTTVNLVYTGAPLSNVGGVNMTGNRIYLWAAVQGIPDTLANGGVGIIIGDGINQRAYYVGGSDFTTGFQQGSWGCYVLDLANLSTTNFATIAGVAAVTISAISAVGIRFKTVAKAQGTSLNCFVDCVRYGTGITAYGGTSGAPIAFSDLAADDASTATGKAYGIIRKIQTGVYGIQGNIIIGDPTSTNSVYFKDSDAVIVVEDHLYGTGTPTEIDFTVTSNSTGTSHFECGIAVGSGDTQSGRNGVVIKNANLTQPVVFDASNANLQTLLMYGCTLSGLKKASTSSPKFSSNATNAPNHLLSGCTFDRCGQSDIGLVPTRNLIVDGYSVASSGSLLWSNSINIKNSKFIANASASTTAAIQHPAQGTFTYDNLTFAGNDFDIDYTAAAASGVLTINASNGANPSTNEILNSAGNSVVINNGVTVKITVVNTSNTPIQNARVAIYKSGNILAGQEIINTLTNSSGVATVTYSYLADQAIVIRVRAETPVLKIPVNTTFTQGGTGTLIAGTYYYRVSATNDIGETLASSETSLTIANLTSVNVNWGAVTDATGYKVYGRSTGAELFIASVSGGSTTTFNDDGSVITPSGALPASNTSGTVRYVSVDAPGTITVSGFAATYTLAQDAIAATSPL